MKSKRLPAALAGCLGLCWLLGCEPGYVEQPGPSEDAGAGAELDGIVKAAAGVASYEAETFAPTGAWTNWNTAKVTVSLNAGNNTIRVLANSSSGGPNLDRMEVEK